jgi:GT2 family glycosyltransferase
MSSSSGISVIVPTYNRRECVQALLLVLTRQTLPAAEFEVIISIDGSDDGTREMVNRYSVPYKLRVICGDVHRGRAAACNSGIRTAERELLVILDDDMEPVPGFLAAHQVAHQSSPKLGVLGPVPIPVNSDSSPVVRYVGEKFNRHLEALSQPGYRFKLRDFYTGNFSIPRCILVEAGGFDEAFTLYGHEDLDLFRRLKQVGVQVIYKPDAVAYQHYTKNFPALVQDHIDKGRTAVLLVSKDPGAFAESRLNTYREGPLKSRMVRSVLLHISALSRRVPNATMALMQRLERRWVAAFVKLCPTVLDYFFWLGARAAMRESQRGGIAKLTHPCRP